MSSRFSFTRWTMTTIFDRLGSHGQNAGGSQKPIEPKIPWQSRLEKVIFARVEMSSLWEIGTIFTRIKRTDKQRRESNAILFTLQLTPSHWLHLLVKARLEGALKVKKHSDLPFCSIPRFPLCPFDKWPCDRNRSPICHWLSYIGYGKGDWVCRLASQGKSWPPLDHDVQK